MEIDEGVLISYVGLNGKVFGQCWLKEDGSTVDVNDPESLRRAQEWIDFCLGKK